MVVRGESLISLEQPFVPLLPGERPQRLMCRMRSLGCSPCTGAVRSDADTVPKIIEELIATQELRASAPRHRPRSGRVDGAEEARRLLLMPGLLRICTAGSVDDGKSTLIGRLLYDSRSVYEDQVHSVREGVAQPHRRPDRLLAVHRRPEGRARAGHHHRRRLPLLRHRAAQVHPRRHARPRAVHAQHGDRRVDRRRGDPAGRRPPRRARAVAPARADRAAARHQRLRPRRQQDGPGRLRPRRCSTTSSTSSTGSCPDAKLHPIPMSALHGDNVITRSERTPWFDGAPLLEFLETVEVDRDADQPSRSACRCSSCSRPNQRFPRLRRADSSPARCGPATWSPSWPSGRTTPRQAHRHLGRRPRGRAVADVGHADARGRDRHQPRRHASPIGDIEVGQRFRADVVWMDERPLDPGARLPAEAHHAAR